MIFKKWRWGRDRFLKQFRRRVQGLREVGDVSSPGEPQALGDFAHALAVALRGLDERRHGQASRGALVARVLALNHDEKRARQLAGRHVETLARDGEDRLAPRQGASQIGEALAGLAEPPY